MAICMFITQEWQTVSSSQWLVFVHSLYLGVVFDMFDGCFVCIGLVMTGGFFYRAYLRGPRNYMYRDYYTGLYYDGRSISNQNQCARLQISSHSMHQ